MRNFMGFTRQTGRGSGSFEYNEERFVFSIFYLWITATTKIASWSKFWFNANYSGSIKLTPFKTTYGRIHLLYDCKCRSKNQKLWMHSIQTIKCLLEPKLGRISVLLLLLLVPLFIRGLEFSSINNRIISWIQ